MRTLLALVAVALGCSDPTVATGDAATAACGTPPAGMRYVAPGCTPECTSIHFGLIDLTCRADGGTAFCADDRDIHNCGACGHDCPTTECSPIGGATYSSACGSGHCICTRTN